MTTDPDGPPLDVPGLTFVFRAAIAVGPPIELGPVDGARRRVIPILGGRVAGPRLTAEVLPGGADWQAIRADGAADIHALYTLRANDGTVISIDNIGIRRGPPDVIARLAAGDDVDPALYYFRTTPRFTVGAGPHRWLAETVFVATGARRRESVVIDTFALG